VNLVKLFQFNVLVSGSTAILLFVSPSYAEQSPSSGNAENIAPQGDNLDPEQCHDVDLSDRMGPKKYQAGEDTCFTHAAAELIQYCRIS
jgi:hypothetical protein